jgi:hypothetical protein
MFRKKDGGISGCSKKNVRKSERFFDDHYKRMPAFGNVIDQCAISNRRRFDNHSGHRQKFA